MPKKTVKKTTKQRLRSLKKKAGKKAAQIKSGVKKRLNINRYNKYLFIFETILFVGVADEFFESLIMQVPSIIFLKILLLMLSIGIIFSVALAVIEKITKSSIKWLVRLSGSKFMRVLVHLIIFAILFYLYGKVFFDTEVSLFFNVGLRAS